MKKIFPIVLCSLSMLGCATGEGEFSVAEREVAAWRSVTCERYIPLDGGFEFSIPKTPMNEEMKFALKRTTDPDVLKAALSKVARLDVIQFDSCRTALMFRTDEYRYRYVETRKDAHQELIKALAALEDGQSDEEVEVIGESAEDAAEEIDIELPQVPETES